MWCPSQVVGTVVDLEGLVTWCLSPVQVVGTVVDLSLTPAIVFTFFLLFFFIPLKPRIE